MDETAIQMNMPANKTVHKVGAKSIIIKTQRQEKVLVSAILACNGIDEKLKLFVIFKGKKYGNIYKKLIKEKLIENNKIEIFVNEKAQATKEIIILWLKNIYIPLIKESNLNRSLLVWDNATMHNNYDILKLLSQYKINVVFVPKGMTSILQPLDVSINRVFKDWMKREYEYIMSCFDFSKIKQPKIKRNQIINFIYKNWYEDSRIKKKYNS